MTRKGLYATLPQEEKDRLNAKRRERYKTPMGRRAMLNSSTKARYGITNDDKDRMLVAQGGCASCGSQDPGGIHGWHIDHNHATGAVRAILCHHCNVILGHAKDDPDKLMSCVAYLLSFENILETASG